MSEEVFTFFRGETLLRDSIEFLQQFRTRFQTTGAVAPSSRFLARRLTDPLRRAQSDRGSVRILEVGPGTGAVTRHIVPLLKAGDHLDLVELNAAFVDVLTRRFRRNRAFRDAGGSAEIHRGPIQEFHPAARYDFVISGLPLNNFSAELVREILDHVFELMEPGATLSYFEYMYLRGLRKRTAKTSEKARLKELDETLAGYLDRYRIRQDRVLLNIPPAWVQHLRKPLRNGHV